MVDLHMHSVYSDGTCTPAELVALAEEGGVAALALTDHDTVAGIPDLLAAAENSPVEIVPGIEISATCARGTMHILGYLIDPTSAVLLEKIKKMQRGRDQRNQEILKKLNKLGYVLQWSEIEQQAGKDVVGRPHIAAALLQRGYVKTRKAAFDLLLAKGRPAYADRYHFSPQESIEMIHAAGGAAVLAHPATLALKDKALKQMLEELKGYGLDGVETYYSSHRPDQIAKFAQWGEELGLICTGGSDFHGANTPDIKVGTGFGQLNVPDEVLAQLKSAVAAA